MDNMCSLVKEKIIFDSMLNLDNYVAEAKLLASLANATELEFSGFPVKVTSLAFFFSAPTSRYFIFRMTP